MVLLGDLDLSTNNDIAAPIKVPIKRVIKHEGYDTRKNDIAVIELAETVTFNKSFIRPACLQFDEFRGTKVAAVSASSCLQSFLFDQFFKKDRLGASGDLRKTHFRQVDEGWTADQ